MGFLIRQTKPPWREGSATISSHAASFAQVSQVEAIDTLSPIHRINVEQFHRMIEAGVFADRDRVELIDGEMRDMAPIGPPHGGFTSDLNMVFASRLANTAIVSVQGPLVLDDGTEVYPDLLVLEPREDRYRKSNPTAADVLLAVEVADSSLSIDLGVKLAKYACAGIRRYWVVDIRNRAVHDHRDPDRNGRRYRQLHTLKDGVLSVTIHGVEVQVDLGELMAA
jgi:Uma2 family endonuclease